MTKQELTTITTKSDVPDSAKVVIRVTYPDGTIDNLQIDSFSIFSDCITLNAKSDSVAGDSEFRPKNQFADEDENQGELEWWSDGFNNQNHNHHLKVNDCVVVMDSNVPRIFFVTSFDAYADYAARGVFLYDYGDICSNGAMVLKNYRNPTKYRKATEDEIKHAIHNMSVYAWEALPTQLQEQYKQYR